MRDARSFDRAAEILKFFNVESVALMTNNPEKAAGLRKSGVKVSETISLAVAPENPYLRKTYLDKVEYQNHAIDI